MGVERQIEYQGRVFSLKDLAAELGLKPSALKGRMSRGWPEERWGLPPDNHRAKYQSPRRQRNRAGKRNEWAPTRNGYSEEELWMLYRDRLRYHPEEEAMEMLADFAMVSCRGAEKLMEKWIMEGRMDPYVKG